MNKRKLHHVHTKLRLLKTTYIVILLAVTVIGSIYALRQNNLNVIKLRDNVVEVDKNNGDIERALHDLREYIHGHMNTNLASGRNAIKPPIQLRYSYERLVAAEKARVSAVNEKVNTDAQVICEQRFPSGPSIHGRVPCTQDYIATNGTKEQPIQDALYKFDFVSPLWSPDLAGFAIALSILLTVTLLVKITLNRWLKQQLHDHM